MPRGQDSNSGPYVLPLLKFETWRIRPLSHLGRIMILISLVEFNLVSGFKATCLILRDAVAVVHIITDITVITIISGTFIMVTGINNTW